MKKQRLISSLFFPFFITILLLVLPMTHAQLGTTDGELLEQAILDQIKIEVDPQLIRNPTIEKVFGGKLFKVEVTIKDGQSSSSGKREMAIVDGKAVMLEETTTNMGLPVLRSLLRKDFRIKNMADAKTFQKALDALYPPGSFFDEDEKKAKEIIQHKSGWIFTTGTFFDDRKGFIAITDDEGEITSLRYSLEIPARK